MGLIMVLPPMPPRRLLRVRRLLRGRGWASARAGSSWAKHRWSLAVF